MSSGMNLEQAKEYAKTMTYSQAISNIKHSKGIKYRKATMIKLRELAEIADRYDRKTEPQTSGVVWIDNEMPIYHSTTASTDELQTEAEIIIEMALNDCRTKHNGCENCGTECMWRDKSQTERNGR